MIKLYSVNSLKGVTKVAPPISDIWSHRFEHSSSLPHSCFYLVMQCSSPKKGTLRDETKTIVAFKGFNEETALSTSNGVLIEWI